MLHKIPFIIIYSVEFLRIFEQIIYSLILSHLLRRLDKSLALGELPEFHNHKKNTKTLTNEQKQKMCIKNI